MEIIVKPGLYILAVSGGVDSMVLLDLLAKKPDIKLVVGHFNHGIRADSAADEELVMRRARQLRRPFEVGYGHLGQQASEDAARQARYKFLYSIQQKHQAKAVITAHHQDDLIETALLNVLRGSGRRGLVSMLLNRKITRPLMAYSKKQIINYAKENTLNWREDTTNCDNSSLRNYVRNKLIRHLAPAQRRQLIKNIDKVAKIDKQLDNDIAKISHIIYHNRIIDRQKFALLPTDIAGELVVYWLRDNKTPEFDKKTINRISTALKTYKANSLCPVAGDIKLRISGQSAQFSQSV